MEPWGIPHTTLLIEEKKYDHESLHIVVYHGSNL